MKQWIDKWEEHIYRIKVPVPFPLRWINSYVVREQNGWTVIDPGLRTEQALEVWAGFFNLLEISIGDVTQIILTHHHPDHIGLAGWMQEQCGAPVMLHPAGWQQASDLWGTGRPKMDQLLLKTFAEHGLPSARVDSMKQHLGSFIPQVHPLPEVTSLLAGDTVWFGGRQYEAISTPGHAQGHISLYDKLRGNLFCGDHVLPRITPNVSYLPGVDDNPLATYLDSLQNMLHVDVNMAFPGHRDPFTTYHTRIKEILDHHAQRLGELHVWIQKPQTAYELCERMFGSRLSIHQLRFALAETLAHLIYLQHAGQATQQPAGDLIRWFST